MSEGIGTAITYSFPNRPDTPGTITRANPSNRWVTFPQTGARAVIVRFTQRPDGEWREASKGDTSPILKTQA